MHLNITFDFAPYAEPMHDNGTQTIKAEVAEPVVEPQEVCKEEANTSSSHSPSPRTVYTCNDGKVSVTGPGLTPFLSSALWLLWWGGSILFSLTWELVLHKRSPLLEGKQGWDDCPYSLDISTVYCPDSGCRAIHVVILLASHDRGEFVLQAKSLSVQAWRTKAN